MAGAVVALLGRKMSTGALKTVPLGLKKTTTSTEPVAFAGTLFVMLEVVQTIHGSECWRNRPGFGWHAVSQKLRAIQYDRAFNIIILNHYVL